MREVIRQQFFKDIVAQGEEVGEWEPALAARAAHVAKWIGLHGNRPLVLTGCGDSYLAAATARPAFHTWGRCWADAAPAAHLPYLVDSNPCGVLVAVSVSGRVSSTVEALRVARRAGWITVGVTADTLSPLGKEADACLELHSCPPLRHGPVPHTLTNLATLVALYELALALGGASSGVGRRCLVDALAAIRTVAEENAPRIAGHAQILSSATSLILAGSGPNWGTAQLGAAKLQEAALLPAVAQELEEWAHGLYYATSSATGTILIGTPGPGWNRFVRMTTAVIELGGPVVTVVPSGTDLPPGTEVWTLPAGVSELVSPIVAKVPLELLAFSVAEKEDRHPFDFGNPRRHKTRVVDRLPR